MYIFEGIGEGGVLEEIAPAPLFGAPGKKRVRFEV